MRTLFALAAIGAAALALALPAHAQTATPAPAAAPVGLALGPYPTSNCGVYYGINSEAGAGVVENAPAGTTVVGGDIGALIGYACPGATPWFVEGLFDFQNLNAGSNGFGLSGPVHFEQRAGIQTPLQAFIASLGAPSTGTPQALPLLPPGYSAGPPQNYLYAAINEDDISSQYGLSTAHEWLVSPEIGTGIQFNLTGTGKATIVADTFAGIELQSSSFCLGVLGSCPKLGPRFKTGISFKY
jgi:hypothetical protein